MCAVYNNAECPQSSPKHLRQAAGSCLVGNQDKVINFLKAVDEVVPVSKLIMAGNRMNSLSEISSLELYYVMSQDCRHHIIELM